MELALLAALILTNAGWLWHNDRQQQREQAERDKLATRIQAPEAASFIDPDHEPPVASVPFDNDEEMWKALDEAHRGD